LIDLKKDERRSKIERLEEKKGRRGEKGERKKRRIEYKLKWGVEVKLEKERCEKEESWKRKKEG
jgi:hypothetical protein